MNKKTKLKSHPCAGHKVYSIDCKDTSLLKADIKNNGVRPCKMCGYYIVRPIRKKDVKYSVRDLVKNWKEYGRQNA